MDNEKYKAAIEEMRSNNNELIDGMFETIERLAHGNPRWLKKERKMFIHFFLMVIEQMSLNAGVATKINDIREILAETSRHRGRVADLFEERATLTLQSYRVIRHLIRENHIDEALNILDSLIKNLED